MNRPTLAAIALLGLLTAAGPAGAIVWQKGAEPQKVQEGEMKNAGKLLYSPLRVLGGSCVALGGRWALTSRHGTDEWKPEMLAVSFPAISDAVYRVKAVHFPAAGDLALLELDKKVDGAAELELDTVEDRTGKRAWLGGFGFSGEAGSIGGAKGFVGGFNRVEAYRKGKLSIRLSKEGEGETPEVLPARMDSGSPLFVEVEGKWRLAGIASTVTNSRNPGTGDWGNYTRISPVEGWIRKLTK
ncbi:serine protease isoform1 precursor [Haloferula helveola]|uniref:Serine protease isoform1 n=1 Tax=Haloferula helveola TaxID=490095 RepID=A0ABM7R8E3_9BACT|nr:serine protease isoform1 precursor [Haloferula helveola]